MRKILILCLLLVLAAAGWPVYVGVQVETAVREAWTGQLGDFRFHHSVADYDRDNYRARATTLLHIVGDGVDFELHLDHRIRHRLLGAAVDTRLASGQTATDLPPPWRAALDQAQASLSHPSASC
ncbi:MAG: YdgA family protein [Thioalkalivibrio sp.]|nr:YdgA family protein [Thioalkalivibrio sp.]